MRQQFPYYIVSAGLLLVLSACQPLIYGDPFDAPTLKVPLGSLLQLHQALNFEPGYSRSFIQSGKALTYQQLEAYQPFCQFLRYEPPQALETLRTMQADTFRVTRSRQEEEVEGLSGFGVMISLGSIGLGDSRGLQKLSAVLKIKSESQPEIVELRCSVYDQPYQWNYLSVNQIKAILGSLVTLKLSTSSQ
ncbi:MAG: hypothetical protein H8E21_13150 [Gammaproteobacteria bacterium]|nr:hypothetical protein [Gammaproteobacteria bacterium]